MATQDGIRVFLSALRRMGLLTERKGAPPIHDDEDLAALARAWLGLLFDITDDQLNAATVSYLRDPDCCEWYPQPGKILQHVPGRREADLDDGDELWGLVLTQARLVGGSSEPTWPEAHAARITAGLEACGGYRAVCAMSTDEHIAARASFRAVTRTLKARSEHRAEDARVLRLVGGLLKSIGTIDDERRRDDDWNAARDDLPPHVAAELALVVAEDLDGAS